MRKTDELLSVQEVVTRASRLAAKSQLDSSVLGANEVIDPSLFEKSSEHNMLKILNTLEPIARSDSIERYKLMAKGLTSSAKALAEFFDGEDSVLVMTDDLSVRTNRLNLLRVLCNQASMLADFNKIRN
jgi:glycyl-tRNA synthetase beta chain